MFGLIIPTKSEINISDITNDYKTYTIDGFKCYVFNLLAKPIVLIYSEYGKVNSTIATHILLNHFKVNLVVNASFCWTINTNNIGTFLIPRFVNYYNINDALGSEKNEFETLNEYVNNLQKWITSFGSNAIIDILSSDDDPFIFKNVNDSNSRKNIAYFDRESCAIAQTCSLVNIPFCFIKLITENIYIDNFAKIQKPYASKLTETVINVCYQMIYLKY